jgi:hypothetical protein
MSGGNGNSLAARATPVGMDQKNEKNAHGGSHGEGGQPDEFLRPQMHNREVGAFVVSWETHSRRGVELPAVNDVEVFGIADEIHIRIEGRNALVRGFQIAEALNATPIRD